MKQKLDRPFVSAIVPAAGDGTRMEGLDKRFAELADMPILAHTLCALAESDWIDEIIVVVKSEEIPLVLEMIRAFAIPKVHSVVSGGSSRQESVQKGLERVSPQARMIAVHDGARPLVSSRVIAETVLDACASGAAAAAVPVVDTIKIADSKRRITATPDRSSLFAVQTPQVFDLEKYRRAAVLAEQTQKNYTDDCQMLEAAGETVLLSAGDYSNLKITTPADLILAEALLEYGLGEGSV